jgi:iron complex outermembrane receptor protein
MEQIKIDAVNHRAVNAANPAYFERRWHPVTGRVGMMVDLAPKANAYVTYSTAADPPSGILSTINFGSIQDWDLATGRQLEVGSKFDFLDGRGNATLAAYKIVRKNLAMPDPTNANISIPVGQQSSRGIEAQAGLQLAPTLSLRGDVALVDARYDVFTQTVSGVAVSRAGNTPTYVPDRIANLHLGWTLAPAWTLAADVRNVAARWGNVENTQRFDGYTLLGASLSWKIDRKSTLVLRGRNLSDEFYVASGSNQVRLGEPRAFEISLRSTF